MLLLRRVELRMLQLLRWVLGHVGWRTSVLPWVRSWGIGLRRVGRIKRHRRREEGVRPHARRTASPGLTQRIPVRRRAVVHPLQRARYCIPKIARRAPPLWPSDQGRCTRRRVAHRPPTSTFKLRDVNNFRNLVPTAHLPGSQSDSVH